MKASFSMALRTIGYWPITLIILVALAGCGGPSGAIPPTGSKPDGHPASVIRVGEAMEGDGNEIAHISVMIGSKDGPVGVAFANALARQSAGHTNMLVVLEPNLAVKPSTVLVTMVTINDMNQAVQMFGPVQSAVAHAVAEAVDEGVISKAECDTAVIVCNAFVHPSAKDEKAIFANNRTATKTAITRAIKGEPHAAEVIAALKRSS